MNQVETSDAAFRKASAQMDAANAEVARLQAFNMRSSKFQSKHDQLKRQMEDLKQELEVARRDEQAADARAAKAMRKLSELQSANDRLKKVVDDKPTSLPGYATPTRKAAERIKDTLQERHDYDSNPGVLRYIEDLLSSNDTLKTELDEYRTLLSDARDEVLNLKEAIQSIGGEIDADGNTSFLSESIFEASSPPWSSNGILSDTDREWTPTSSVAPSSPTLANPFSPPKLSALHQHHHYHYHVDKDAKSGAVVGARRRSKTGKKLRIKTAVRPAVDSKSVQTSPITEQISSTNSNHSTPPTTITEGFQVSSTASPSRQAPGPLPIRNKRLSNASLLSTRIALQKDNTVNGTPSPPEPVRPISPARAFSPTMPGSPSRFSTSVRSVSSIEARSERDPLGTLYSQAASLHSRLKASDTNSINRRLKKPFVFRDVSQLSNKLLNNILLDIESLQGRYNWMSQQTDSRDLQMQSADFLKLVKLLQDVLADFANARIVINELQGAIVNTVEEKTLSFVKEHDENTKDVEHSTTPVSPKLLRSPTAVTTIAISGARAAADTVAESLSGSVRFLGNMGSRFASETTITTTKSTSSVETAVISPTAPESARATQPQSPKPVAEPSNSTPTPFSSPNKVRGVSSHPPATTSTTTADAEGTWYFTAKVPPAHRRVADMAPAKKRPKESPWRKSLFSVFTGLQATKDEEVESPVKKSVTSFKPSKPLAISAALPTAEVSNTFASPYIGLGDHIQEALNDDIMPMRKDAVSNMDEAKDTVSETIRIPNKRGHSRQQSSISELSSTPSARLLSPMVSAGAANALSMSAAAHSESSTRKSRRQGSGSTSPTIGRKQGARLKDAPEPIRPPMQNTSRSSRFVVIDDLKRYSSENAPSSRAFAKATADAAASTRDATSPKAIASPSINANTSMWSGLLNVGSPMQSPMSVSSQESKSKGKQREEPPTPTTPQTIRRSSSKKQSYLESMTVGNRVGSGTIGGVAASLPGPGAKFQRG